MARPLRIEFPGAVYHVTSRGNAGDAIYRRDADHMRWLDVLSQVRERFNWVIHSYCQMTNHYHLLVETPDGNLARGMRQLNGVYTQRFNRIHSRFGHVFQGRYRAVLVQKDTYLLELSRYIVLNPVRAGIVRSARDWPWSNYRYTAGMTAPPSWLETDWTLGTFAKRRFDAQNAYRQFVAEGKKQPSPWEVLKNQIYLGSESFVGEMQQKVGESHPLIEIPKAQRRPMAKPVAWYFKKYRDRNEAIVEVYRTGVYNMREIGDHVGLHYSRISRIVKSAELAKRKT